MKNTHDLMLPSELKEARLRLGLTQSKMAAALATPFRTYQDWESGTSRIPGAVTLAVRWVLDHLQPPQQKKRKGKP